MFQLRGPVKDPGGHPLRGATVRRIVVASSNRTDHTTEEILPQADRLLIESPLRVPAALFSLPLKADCDLPGPVEEVSSGPPMGVVAWVAEEA